MRGIYETKKSKHLYFRYLDLSFVILCPEQDSNLHTLASTSPSSWRVYQFHHLGMYQNFAFQVSARPSFRFFISREQDSVSG